MSDGEKCLTCDYRRVLDPLGRPHGRNRFVRGLCGKCYSRAIYEGKLESVALPPKDPKSGRRELWSKAITREGYLTIKTPNGVMLDHVHVMEKHLERKLIRGENIHHLNGLRGDNRVENLELWYKPQPAGQRVSDLIDYLAEFHPEETLQAIISSTNKRS